MFGAAPYGSKGAGAPPAPDPDPKHRTGAYVLLHERDLYEVVEWEGGGPTDGMLRVVNVRTMSPLRLTGREVRLARLIEPAVEVPDFYEPAA